MSADSVSAGTLFAVCQRAPWSRDWTSKPFSLSDSSVQVSFTLSLPVAMTCRPVGARGPGSGGGGGGGGGSPGSGR